MLNDYTRLDRRVSEEGQTARSTLYPVILFLGRPLESPGDGDIDIATTGKTGAHFFENLKIDLVPRTQREKELLLEKNWPFPGAGAQTKWQH